MTGGVLQASSNNKVLNLETALEYERARIDWVSNMGDKVDYFVTQRTTDKALAFKDLEIVKNSNPFEKLQYYTLYDTHLSEGDNLYRIKQVLYDGTTTYSTTKKVVYTSLGLAPIFPNPADDKFSIDLKNYVGKDVALYLFNSVGQPVLTKQMGIIGNTTVMDVDVSMLNHGHYLVHIVARGKRALLKQLYIAR